MLLQRLATGATGVKQARSTRGTHMRMRSIYTACLVYIVCAHIAIESPWHLLFNVRQCMVKCLIQCLHMNYAEGFAL